MVTGFRWSLGGAQEYYRVIPDLTCFGKAISNGYPLSVITGHAKFMKKMDEVFVSTTFGGYTLGITAAIETIKMMRSLGNVQRQMHKLGNYFIKEFNKIAEQNQLPARLTGYGPHPIMKVTIANDYEARIFKSYLYQEFNRRGILFSASLMIGYVHKKSDINSVLKAFREIASALKNHHDYKYLKSALQGQVAAPRNVRA